MLKRISGLFVLLALGLLFAIPVFGAETIISWDATDTSELVAWITQVWDDLYVPVLLGLGVALGFIILRKTIGIVKGGAR